MSEGFLLELENFPLHPSPLVLNVWKVSFLAVIGGRECLVRCGNAVGTCMCAPVYVCTFACMYRWDVNEGNSAGHLNICCVDVILRINRIGRFQIGLFCKPRLHFACLCLSARSLRRSVVQYGCQEKFLNYCNFIAHFLGTVTWTKNAFILLCHRTLIHSRWLWLVW